MVLRAFVILFLTFGSWNVYSNQKLSELKKKVGETKKFLNDMEAKFEYRKKALRPKSCPLESKGNENIAKALTNLKSALDKECSSKNQAMISSLNDSITGLNTTYKTEMESGKRFEGVTKEDSMFQAQQQKMEMVSKSLNTFSNLAEKAECKYSLRDQGALSIMSDVIQSVSGLGLLVPNEYGFVAAAGGQAVGSILKIVDIMLTSKYDWKKEEDRNTFIKYNCSFFDIKDQMDDAGIVSVRTNLHKQEIFKKTKELPKIRKLQKELRLLVYDYEYKFRRLVTRPLKLKNMGKVQFQLVEDLDKAKYILEAKASDPAGWSKNMTVQEVKAEVIQELLSLQKQILTNLKLINPEVLGKLATKYELPKSIEKFGKVFNGESKEEIVIPMFLSDIKSKVIKVPHGTLGYIDQTKKTPWFDVLKSSYFKNIDWIYSAIKRYEFKKLHKKQSIASLMKNPKLQAEKWARRLERVENQFEGRIRFLKNVTTGAVFKNNDDGTRLKNNILTSFKNIEKSIYGSTGESFLEYVNKYGRRDILEFESRYKKTEDNYNHLAAVPKGDRFTYCAEARKLQLQWGIAHSVINIGFDFIEANKDSFYTPRRRHKWFAGFIYAGKSRQRYLWENAQSANEANRMIKGKDYDYSKIAFSNKILKKSLIGRLMVRLKHDEPEMQKVQNFIDKYKCNKN